MNLKFKFQKTVTKLSIKFQITLTCKKFNKIEPFNAQSPP